MGQGPPDTWTHTERGILGTNGDLVCDALNEYDCTHTYCNVGRPKRLGFRRTHAPRPAYTLKVGDVLALPFGKVARVLEKEGDRRSIRIMTEFGRSTYRTGDEVLIEVEVPDESAAPDVAPYTITATLAPAGTRAVVLNVTAEIMADVVEQVLRDLVNAKGWTVTVQRNG